LALAATTSGTIASRLGLLAGTVPAISVLRTATLLVVVWPAVAFVGCVLVSHARTGAAGRGIATRSGRSRLAPALSFLLTRRTARRGSLRLRSAGG
jgi:hypothetical protein